MRKIHRPSEKKTPPTTVAGVPSRRSFEWPLLIYPVLFVSALAVLYVVSRSIQTTSPTPAGVQRTTDPQAVTPEHENQQPAPIVAPGGRTEFASNAASNAQEQAGATGPNAHPASVPGRDVSDSGPGRTSSIAGRMRHAVDLSQLQGAAKTTALLCIAVDEMDHARIKQCLAELVALGDEAVAPLSDLMKNEQSEAALWAATALARIGTPTAAGALLDRLAQTKDGSYKEELGKRASEIRNHDSWPFLLDTMMQASDTTVVRAAGTSLSKMADAPIIDEVIARYDEATTEAEINRLAQLVRTIQSPQATESLLSLAGPVSSAPQDSLQDAAIEALARVGDAQCVSYLLQRLEASAPGEDTPVFNALTRINSPEAQSSLLYAAAGNKEVSAEHGRTAAIYALKNYPNEQTVALLERIVAQEQNQKVLSAAIRTLDDIQQSPHAVTASADSLVKSEQVLPFQTLEK